MTTPELVEMPLAEIVAFWRPGSYGPEWTWRDEYHDLWERDAFRMTAITNRVKNEGVGFSDDNPVTLGGDGRVWDGHHRICIALHLGTPTLMVELV